MRFTAIAALVLASLQPVQPPPQTFRSGTQLVEVEVRVFEGGRFVDNLTSAEFEITEDGVPQRIRSVLRVRAMPPRSGDGASAAGTTTPSPGGAPPRIWIFVFDTPHLGAAGLQRTREAVEKFIAERFRDGDIGGVVADGRMVNGRLTSDREELKRAAASVKAPGDMRSRQLAQREWPRLHDELEAFRIVRNDRDAIQSAVSRACADDPSQCRMARPDAQVRSKAQQLVGEYRRATQQTLAAVDALGKGLARLPGSKTVVFLSEGFVVEEQGALLRQVVGQAARAGAHVYAIDARGLNTGAGAQLIDAPQADSPMGAPARFDVLADGANSLAVDTGGFAIRNENDFGRALDDIQRDAGVYYVVGYTPANNEFDGKYRAIEVKVARPGVTVRARRGYLATEPPAGLQPSMSAPSQPAAVESSTTAAVPPKLAASSATQATPALDAGVVSPKQPDNAAAAKADIPIPVSPTDSIPVIPLDSAVRTRIDAGRMALALGKDASVALNSPAERGWEAYEKGDVEAAAVHLAEAAAAPDARAWVVYVLGLSQFALGRHRDAAQSWERVRRAAPEFEPIYFSLADAYTAQEDEAAAIRVLRDAEARWPADPEIANAIGVIQVRRGALDAAIGSFTRATSIAPSDALGHFNLGRALQMRLLKSQRYDRQMEKWVGGDEDRRRAIASFAKYVELGGPYEQQAREALASLAWK